MHVQLHVMQFLTAIAMLFVLCGPQEQTQMPEHKPDEFTATGSHRVWSPTMTPPVVRNWPPAAPQPNANNNRHGAITRSLKNFPSYKSWTDKIKSTWKPEK